MIKLPDFSKCVDFQRLREKMGITVIPILPSVIFEREVIHRTEVEKPNTEAVTLETKLQAESIPATYEELQIDREGLITYKGRKVAAYIRDQRWGVDYYRGTTEYKYHLCNCSTLQGMKAKGRQNRYLVTKRSDGKFEVNDLSLGSPRRFIAKADLCKNCIRELNYMRMYNNPFSLKKYFERYDSQVPKTIRDIETVTEIQTYAPNHADISREYKIAANHCCQSCGVDSTTYKSLLHLHHCDGDPSNNQHENLRILCVDCHSKQPMHIHVKLPQKAKEQILKIQALRREQGIIDLGSERINDVDNLSKDMVDINSVILIIDDEESIRLVLSEYFRNEQYETLSASHSAEALELLSNKSVDIVLTDINHPGLDGLELTKLIRKKFDTEVIIHTGYKEYCSHEKAKTIGAFELFYKPVKLKELLNSVKRVVEMRHSKKYY